MREADSFAALLNDKKRTGNGRGNGKGEINGNGESKFGDSSLRSE